MNLFWAAFGAIGTTAGSLATAIAVIIGVKQYLQPLDKRVKVEFGIGFPLNLGFEYTLMYINAVNQGTRPVYINGFYIKLKKEKLLLFSAQDKNLPQISFPVCLQPEEKCEINMRYDTIKEQIASFVKQGKITKYSKLKVYVDDNAGDQYYSKKKIHVKELISK
jgi:hypothetical protein